LGATQGIVPGYQTPEVRQRLTELAPCFENGFNSFPGCGGSTANPNFAQYDLAKRTVARELSRDLDRKPWAGDFNHTGSTTNDTYGTFAKGTFVLPADLEFTTITGYDHYERKIDLDLDFSPETLFAILTQDHGYQVTEDLKLAGETDVAGTPFSWDVGGWYLHDRIDVNVGVDLGNFAFAGAGNREYSQRIDSLGGYGSFSFDFWDDFTLDGGARWNWEDKNIPDYVLTEGTGSSPLKTPLYHAPTGTIRLTYRFREDTHAFWKYTRGWKPGHFNATGSRFQGITKADPETIDAFETGLRAEWFGGILSGDTSLFYYNYENYQIFTAQQFSGGGPEFVVVNAKRAEVLGAEIQALLRPWAGGFMGVNFSWLKTEFLDFVQIQQQDISNPATGQNVTINRELDNSGHPLLNSPEFKVSITAEQHIPLGKYGFLIPRYDGVWTDTTYYDATEGRGIPNVDNVPYAPKLTFAQRPFWLHSVRLGYQTPDGRLEIAGWVRNIENTPYKTFAFDGSTFQATTIYFVGDPRTYGGTVTVTF
jgi:iron complex outermembrane receptor protein